MLIPTITDRQMNELRIIATKGGENANLAFSRWLREKAKLEVTDVSLVPFGDIAKIMGEGDRMVVTVLMRMTGKITGNTVLIFSEESARHLIGKMIKKTIIPPNPPLEKGGIKGDLTLEKGGKEDLGNNGFDVMDRSIMEETGNIIVTAFLNSLVAHLDIAISSTPPVFIHDYAGAILEMAVMEYAPVADYALLFNTEFYEVNTKVDGYFFILPSPESLNILLEKIEGR
jgi:chemotaxis protein CheC